MSSHLPVVVVGAGMGGLSAAIRLQAAGVPTLLIDRNTLPGGKLNLVEANGYRFDTGPSLLTMPEVFEELFAASGMSLRDELEIVKLDPYCRYLFDDGTTFDTSDSMEQMSRTLLRHAPDDVAAFFTFLGRAAAWYRMSVESVIYGAPMDWRAMKGSKLDPVAFFRMRPFQSLDALIRSTFRDEKVRRIARLIALYTGCAPARTPAIFSLIPFLEFGLGRWYVQGGLYRIAEVLRERYRGLGGKHRGDTTVERIRFRDGRAREAVLSDGSEIEARHFVVNADVALAASTFLADAPGAARMRSRLGRLRKSTSAFVLLIGAKTGVSNLVHHNLVFSADEEREWTDIFRRGLPPSEPTVYLNHPGFTDPALAPAGGAALFAMVNVPSNDPSRFDWMANRARYEEIVLSRLEARILPDLRKGIEVLESRTPLDFQERTFADGGSLYGRAPESLRAMMMRPRNVESGFDGVSFVGGTTHPGAGIPLAALSGKLVAGMILDRERSRA